LSNKELFKSQSRLRSAEWTSPSTGAVFNVMQPNAGQAIELSKIAAAGKSETEVVEKIMEYVWTHLVQDPESGKAFTPAEYRDLLKVKDLLEMGEPVKLTMDYIQTITTVSAEAMQKNSGPTA
jgi:hypothetical protein